MRSGREHGPRHDPWTAYINGDVCDNLLVGRDRIGGHRFRWSAAATGGLLGALMLAGCGAAHTTIRTARPVDYRVQVVSARFPAHQRLAEHTHLVIAVRNAGHAALPDVAVTITNPRYGTAVQPFATYLPMSNVEGHSRPVWVVERPPGRCGFSCRAGGPGGAATPETHTWTLGRLPPGATARFGWTVAAVMAGNFQVRYMVEAALGARPSAVVSDGRPPFGTFDVVISAAPKHETVSDSGAIVSTK